MGDFELKFQGEAFYLASGMYEVKGAAGTMFRFRSIGTKFILEEERLTKKKLPHTPLEMVGAMAPGGTTYKVKVYRPLKAREALRDEKLDKMNEFFYDEKEFSINSDFRRVWAKQFSGAAEALSSNHGSSPRHIIRYP